MAEWVKSGKKIFPLVSGLAKDNKKSTATNAMNYIHVPITFCGERKCMNQMSRKDMGIGGKMLRVYLERGESSFFGHFFSPCRGSIRDCPSSPFSFIKGPPLLLSNLIATWVEFPNNIRRKRPNEKTPRLISESGEKSVRVIVFIPSPFVGGNGGWCSSIVASEIFIRLFCSHDGSNFPPWFLFPRRFCGELWTAVATKNTE